MATIISAVAGLALAIAFREAASRRKSGNVLLQIPLAMPHLIVGVMLLNFIAPRLTERKQWLIRLACLSFQLLIHKRRKAMMSKQLLCV